MKDVSKLCYELFQKSGEIGIYELYKKLNGE